MSIHKETDCSSTWKPVSTGKAKKPDRDIIREVGQILNSIPLSFQRTDGTTKTWEKLVLFEKKELFFGKKNRKSFVSVFGVHLHLGHSWGMHRCKEFNLLELCQCKLNEYLSSCEVVTYIGKLPPWGMLRLTCLR